ncbi:SWIB complex BAF60b domain-containing protein [Actinidia rufa]|uniref:SWIB complex BAF60b domain-containing protein n=1 Tax=Actinidia rufa TaxID=165716 RepID=A0A7J0EW86_9ERIC|nr:SWIB complex BAF60b domain-containing protein [Actinidia rufa]
MVSDQEIAKGVETVLRQSDPNAVTTLNGVVQQVEAELGLDLSHKASFIRDQINLLLRSHPQPQPQPPNPPKDHFALQHHPQYPQFHPHFALQPQHPHPHYLYGNPPPPLQQQQPPPPQSPVATKREANVQDVATNASAKPKESVSTGSKRRGGPGGLNKVCGVSPELQAVVGEPALPRTEIVKQLWAYIRKNNLQDPSNKRKIICDDALRVVFETDCTDMFKMNKLLAKHIIPLGPTKESGQAKRLKVDVETATESSEPGSQPIIISEALAEFFGTGEREMPQSEAFRCVWEYIKVNRLEDPLNSMAILCDSKLQKLFGCESISAFGISEMLSRHHLFKR